MIVVTTPTGQIGRQVLGKIFNSPVKHVGLGSAVCAVDELDEVSLENLPGRKPAKLQGVDDAS